MKCKFAEIESPDASGKRRVRCERCHLTLHPTATRLERISAKCRGWPRSSEWGYWLALFLEAFGVTKIRWWKFKMWLGLIEPRGCASCEQRERWMNTLGGRIVTTWRRLTKARPES